MFGYCASIIIIISVIVDLSVIVLGLIDGAFFNYTVDSANRGKPSIVSE